MLQHRLGTAEAEPPARPPEPWLPLGAANDANNDAKVAGDTAGYTKLG